MKIAISGAGILLLILITFISKAQVQNPETGRFKKPAIEKAGFSFGFGAGGLNLKPLNERLDHLQIGILESVFVSGTYRVSAADSKGRELSLDIDLGATIGNSLMNDANSFMSLSIFS